MKGTDKKVAPDETVIPDARAGLTPEQQADKKFEKALGAPPQAPKRSTLKPDSQGAAPRRPERASKQ